MTSAWHIMWHITAATWLCRPLGDTNFPLNCKYLHGLHACCSDTVSPRAEALWRCNRTLTDVHAGAAAEWSAVGAYRSDSTLTGTATAGSKMTNAPHHTLSERSIIRPCGHLGRQLDTSPVHTPRLRCVHGCMYIHDTLEQLRTRK